MAANDHQIGGDHYKKYGMFQPWDCFMAWNLNGFQAHIIPYVVRYRDKDGLKDLYKARHFLNKLIEYEEAQVAAIPTLTEKAP
jgi:hypothetical protein